MACTLSAKGCALKHPCPREICAYRYALHSRENTQVAEQEVEEMITTSTPHGLKVGDVVTIPVPLGFKLRLKLWLSNPFKWPSKTFQREFTVKEVSRQSVGTIERLNEWMMK